MLRAAVVVVLSVGLAGANAPMQSIVGGVATDIGSHPWQVAVLMFNEPWCGGTIVGARWVLSAAHCAVEERPSAFSILYGATYDDRRHSHGYVVYVDLYRIHWLYEVNSNDYDIAVLHTKRDINYGKNVKPARLATSDPAPGSYLMVTGWGRISENGQYSSRLREVSVAVIDIRQCRECLRRHLVSERMLCAGYLQGGRDACQGDSGGPAMIGDVQFGITSWGVGCAREGFPGVYTSVPALREWIVTNTKGELEYP